MNNPKLEEKKLLAWKELIQEVIQDTTKNDDELTCEEFAELIGKSREAAKAILQSLEELGKVTSRTISYNRTRTKVYAVKS